MFCLAVGTGGWSSGEGAGDMSVASGCVARRAVGGRRTARALLYVACEGADAWLHAEATERDATPVPNLCAACSYIALSRARLCHSLDSHGGDHRRDLASERIDSCVSWPQRGSDKATLRRNRNRLLGLGEPTRVGL